MSKESTKGWRLPTLDSLDQVKMSGTYYVGHDVVERTYYPMGLVIDFTDSVYDEFGALLYVRAGNSDDAWRRERMDNGEWSPWKKELVESR